jgi:hypothetical protein
MRRREAIGLRRCRQRRPSPEGHTYIKATVQGRELPRGVVWYQVLSHFPSSCVGRLPRPSLTAGRLPYLHEFVTLLPNYVWSW